MRLALGDAVEVNTRTKGNIMLYESPCDVPGYLESEYPEEYSRYLEAKSDYEINEYESRDLFDRDELPEVKWESYR